MEGRNTLVAPEVPTQKDHPSTMASQNEPDVLGEIDEVLDLWAQRRRDARRHQLEVESERREFIRHAEAIGTRVIRPTFQAIAQRLRASGGDGKVVERPRDGKHELRLTLWMALDREVAIVDRPDLYPYLRLDLDVPHRRFTAWEGDMWERQGASRPGAPLGLNDVTAAALTARVVAVLQRAAAHEVRT